MENNQTTIITNDSEILKHCKSFFSKLYTKTQINIEIQNELLKPIQPKPVQNEKVIQKLSLTKLKTAIFHKENNKSPGIHGIPIEFYKSQYSILKYDLLQLYNSILFQNEDLTPTTQAIITLVPKYNQKEFLENWRPISLLCAD